MSVLSDLLGTTVPKPKQFSPEDVRASMLYGMDGDNGYMAQMNKLGDTYGDQATNQFGYQQQAMGYGTRFLDQAQGLMAGQSPILDAMRSQQRQDIGDAAMQSTQNMNQQMAARGMGGGGLRNVLGNINTGAAGEQIRKGLLGIQQYGLQAGAQMGNLGIGAMQQAQGFGGLGLNAMGGQQSAYGDVASLQAQANQAATQQEASNIAGMNQYRADKAAANRAMWGGIAQGALSFAMPAAAGGMFGNALQQGAKYIIDNG